MYSDKNKVAGVNVNDPQEKQRIYERYLRAFKKGVFNYIKEETDTLSQETIPRKYFSGGFNFTQLSINPAMRAASYDEAMTGVEQEEAEAPGRIEEVDAGISPPVT